LGKDIVLTNHFFKAYVVEESDSLPALTVNHGSVGENIFQQNVPPTLDHERRNL